MQFHPNDLTLQGVLHSPASSSHPKVFEHLTRCNRCRLRLKGLQHLNAAAPKTGPTSETTNYDLVLDRVQEQVQIRLRGLEQEHRKAENLFHLFMERTYDEQYRAVQRERPLQTWSILNKLISRGKEETFHDPSRAENLLLLSLEMAKHIDSCYGRDRIEDMRARSWAEIGNTRRVRSDLKGAEEAFGLAYTHLQHGTKDALEEAGVIELEASLLRSQKLYDLALRKLQRALSIFRHLGETHRTGRALILISLVRNYEGDPKQALLLLHQASELINYNREPRLLLDLLHNFSNTLVDLGCPQQAHTLFLRLDPLYKEFSGGYRQIFQQWLESKIARGLGRNHDAEMLLTSARDGFLSRGMTVYSQVTSRELMHLGRYIYR